MKNESRLILRHVRQLLLVATLVSLAMAGYPHWQELHEGELRQRTSDYHQASLLLCANAQQVLDELTQLVTPGAPVENAPARQLVGLLESRLPPALQHLRQMVAELHGLYVHFGGASFGVVLAKIERQKEKLLLQHQLQSGILPTDPGLLQEQVDILQLSLSQLKRLHLAAQEELEAALKQRQELGQVMLVLMAALLLGVGSALGWRTYSAINGLLLSRDEALGEAAQARRAAEVANRAKSDFLAAMSHEIRTPLNAVVGMSDLLRESNLTTDQQEYLRVLERNSEALLAIINDILDLSKVESGNMRLVEGAVAVEELLQGVRQLFEPKARSKGIALGLAVDTRTPRLVQGDEARLRQVLLNLVGNAIKFTDSGGIVISVGPDPVTPRTLRFQVKDTGVGIPADKLEFIFDAFTQADGSTSRRFGGTGLGLAICRRLVTLMEGHLWVISAPGQGSLFQFTLPLRPVEALQGAAKAAESHAAQPPRSLAILLAEDAPDNQLLIASYLKQSPHQLVIAADGEEAFRLFQERQFDLVLMDVQMPRLDGYAATRAIRRWEEQSGRPRTPILALTAHALAEAMEHSLQAGCDQHLTKPIRKATLLETLHRYAERPAASPPS